MQRNVQSLTDREFDLLVIGGGSYGAAAAWNAVQRGLDVALIERSDFGGGVSANCFKMVHGGIRYVQHGDIRRVRRSARERSALLRMAPHLVHPLPILIPTYGHGRRGKLLLGTGMLLYDALTLDRNRHLPDRDRRIPPSRFLSRSEVLTHFPDLAAPDLTGAAVFCDGQMYNPPRLVLAFVQSAVAGGAIAANYVEATDFIVQEQCVRRVRAIDRLTGDELEIRARFVLNATGPWAEDLLDKRAEVRLEHRAQYSRDAYLVVPRLFDTTYAIAVQGRTHDPDAILARGARHLFIAPWHGRSIIGVWHRVSEESPDHARVSTGELGAFVSEINDAYPSLQLRPDDVMLWNAGLVPFGENDPHAVHLSYGKESIFIDHKSTHGIDGLITLIGIRYTMARGDAEIAVGLIVERLGRDNAAPTALTPLWGGDIDEMQSFERSYTSSLAARVPADVIPSLLRNYGTRCAEVVALMEADGRLAQRLAGSSVIGAQVAHAVRYEMAVRLSDIVFRRTDLATGSIPEETALLECAALAAQELGWDAAMTRNEIDTVRRSIPSAENSRWREGALA